MEAFSRRRSAFGETSEVLRADRYELNSMSPECCRLLRSTRSNQQTLLKKSFCILIIALIGFFSSAGLSGDDIDDLTGKYHFLTADDTLALLEEEGRLKGYIDVYQGEEESDTVLSYPITIGARKKDRVEFKTGKIHQKYFRFAGAVQRGTGHEETDPDYLRLVGDLEIVVTKASPQEEAVQRMHVIFKSMGKAEKSED